MQLFSNLSPYTQHKPGCGGSCLIKTGTSNWSENYFTHTAGVGLVVNQTGSEVGPDQATLRSQAEELFLRDWASDYATPLKDDEAYVCPHHHH